MVQNGTTSGLSSAAISVATLLALALGGCGDSSTDSPLPGEVVLTAPATAVVATGVAVSVQALTESGSPVAGRNVEWEILLGGGSFSASAGVTNSGGVSQTIWTPGTQAGPGRVRVVVEGFDPTVANVQLLPGLAQSVIVTPASQTVPGPGYFVDFSASASDPFGNPLPPASGGWTWASSDEAVASVSSGGRATAMGPGTAGISAFRDGVSGSAELQVGNVDPDPVTFGSPALEAAIRSAIGQPEGVILNVHLLVLTSFSASTAGIVSLSGLDRAVNLRELALNGNSIRDLTPLTRLTALERLELENNDIESIAPLDSLTALQDLRLSGNEIRNVTALAPLFQLRNIRLSNNLIETLHPLANNSGIGLGTTLDVQENPLVLQTLCVEIPLLVSRGVDVLTSVACPGG